MIPIPTKEDDIEFLKKLYNAIKENPEMITLKKISTEIDMLNDSYQFTIIISEGK